ncbi:serpin family protein [Amycolatopsis thailandensis]|uniref:Serpin family protein n=1 Tax=Amycolatopsis thailandensis TaxID=589330 RepID=A0A229S710_9PSEU|nr:serpin family protein [Amycolatopsis thailandensis]OXM54670.1 serpin family protein [Amycolatopsis thailandensis]
MGAVESHLRFGLDLYRVLASRTENACFSPYSIASALGLVTQAAKGKTREELIALLGDPDELADLLGKASSLLDDGPELAVANTLWAWDGLPLEKSFREEIATWPGGKVESAPFGEDPEEARRLINADVAEATRELIPELLKPGTVAPDTVAAIVNALYLKTAWQNPFSRDNTAPADFHAPSGTRTVPTMWLEKQLDHTHEDGWQVVRLGAEGGVEAIILLPDGELDDAELDAGKLSGLLENTRSKTLALSLPKLDLDVDSPLTAKLKELGVRTMFTGDADLTGLADDDRLEVSDVLHQSVLRIDEQGLEGAAATAVLMRLTSIMVEEPLEVAVDRPFLLLVRHASTGVIYFLARVVEP